MSNHLFVASPVYGGGFAGYWLAVMRLMAAKSDTRITYMPLVGDSLITRARNICVIDFLESDADALMFIDSDLEFDPQDVFRLYESGKDIACGVYPKKCYPLDWPANLFQADGGVPIDHGNGMVRLMDAPTGFMLIRRHVVEAMVAAHPELRCKFSHEGNKWGHALFDSQIDAETRMYLSEDFDFCRKAQSLGFEVWADPKIVLSHVGLQRFTGCLSDYLAQQIPGWMQPNEITWLRETATRMDSVVEIGAWKGRSTFALATGCRGQVFSVDHWQGSADERDGPHKEATERDVFADWKANIGHFQNVTALRASSLEAAAAFSRATPPQVDMVFIDAGHTYEEVKADIAAWTPRAGKVLAGHDFNWPDVQRAVVEAFGNSWRNPAGNIWMVDLRCQPQV